MEEMMEGLDLNTASVEALAELPGVDETLAKRIIAYRETHGPFTTPQALLEVEGVDEALLARLVPHIKLEAAPDESEAPPAEEAQAPTEEGDLPPLEVAEEGEGATSERPAVEAESVSEEEAPPAAEAKAESSSTPPPHPFTPGTTPPRSTPPPTTTVPPAQRSSHVAWWAWLWSALVGGLLGMIFTLLVLSGINGSLNIGHSAAVQENRAQIEALDAHLTSLDGEVEGLDTRLRVLEGLTARMETIEEEMKTLSEQVSDVQKSQRELSDQVAGVEERIAELSQAQEKTTTFFKQLQLLMVKLFGTPEEPSISTSPLEPPPPPTPAMP